MKTKSEKKFQTKRNWLFSLVLSSTLLPLFISQPAKSQTALRQLENMAGRSIGSFSAPSPASPGGSTYKNPFQKTLLQLEQEARDHYQKGLKEYANRNWNDAIRQLKKAIRKDHYNQTYKNKLLEAESAYEKEKLQNRELQEKIRREEEARKKVEEEKQRIEKERLDKERKDQEAINERLKKAENTILAFRKDIKAAQLMLRNYTKALNNNNSELEKWGLQIDESYNNVLDNSKEYLAGMFMKYNLMGTLKKQLQKDVYKRMGNLWKSSNPEIQKWMAKQLAAANLKAERVEDIVDFVSKGGELADLLTADKEESGYNLDVLLFINGVLESSGLAGYDKFMENALGNMPGDYFEQAKMIGETYADLSAICYSWFSIRKLNYNNEEIAQKVKIISTGMEQRMDEIECLKKCLKNNTTRCLENCTGKTKWSTPPPPLLFNYRNW